jgi:hypothetical protein
MTSRALLASAIAFGLGALWACSSDDASSPAAVPSSNAPTNDAAPDQPAPDAATQADAATDSGAITGVCADTFGNSLTAGFGRIDGVVYAVQKPSDKQCTMPNDDHVIVQVLMNGAVYRLVTNVQSTSGDPKVRFTTLAHALPAPVWTEGWHEGVTLDYPTDLGAHNADFTPYVMNDLVGKIAAEVHVGAKVSIYGESGDGRPESAHNIHRTSNGHDGAIVVDPTGSPEFLLFHFDEQVF